MKTSSLLMWHFIPFPDKTDRRLTEMKKMILAYVISSLFPLALVAQTPTPPRPTKPGSTPATSTSAGGTGAEGKVAILSTAQFSQGIDELRVKLEALNVELEPKRKEIKVLEDELNNLKNKIQTQGTTVSPQVRNQWVEEATEKERQYKRRAEDYQQIAQKQFGVVSQPVSEKIKKFLESYCKQHGIVVVIEDGAASEAGVLIWFVPTTNITDDFMKEYNKANPVAGSSAPGGAKKQ
jgi:outer membrane protein